MRLLIFGFLILFTTNLKAQENPFNPDKKYSGTYNNDFTGKIIIETHPDGIKVTYADNYVSVAQAQTENTFFIPNEDMRVEFNLDKKTNQITMSFYENDFWSFDAWKSDSK